MRIPSRTPPPYAELHCLSNFSFLRGASHPEELVARAAELGYAALAITDRHSLAGVVRAHQAAKEHGLHLLIGAELTPIDAPPLILLAPDRPAYARLARLLTRGKLRTRKGACAIYLRDIAELAPGLIAIVLPMVASLPRGTPIAMVTPLAHGPGASPPSESQISNLKSQTSQISNLKSRTSQISDRESQTARPQSAFRNPQSAIPNPQSPIVNRQSLRASVPPCLRASLDPSLPRSLDPLRIYREIFGDKLYLAAELTYDVPDEVRLAQLAELSRSTGIPLVAANNVHYHIPERRYLQDVLTCVREQCTLAEAGTRLLPNAERNLRPRDEIARRYAACPELIARTIEIAERCTFSLDELRYEYPHELCPENLTSTEFLARLTWEGAHERYPGGIPSNVRQQIEAELALIKDLNYEPYFLTVWDLARFARRRGILCQGRGSAANSAVCYCLGITAVDPARIDLLFERFISRERNEPPDIDVDFEHERREEVIQYIYEKYGRERAAITGEVIRYRPRSAVRDVGKVLGLSLDRIDVLAKSLDWWDRKAVPEEVITAAGLDPHDRTIQMLVRLVKQILRFPRHLSQHVGGFVITESPLCEIVPLENAAMPQRTFIEWDKDDIDALGILKVDCLALGMLTAISKCFVLLQRHEGTKARRHGEKKQRHGGTEARRHGEKKQRHGGTEARRHGVECSFSFSGDCYEYQDVSRSDCVAEGDGTGQASLPGNSSHAEGRKVWVNKSDAPSGRFDSIKHRGGICEAKPNRLHPVFENGARLAGGTPNTDDPRGATELHSNPKGTRRTARGDRPSVTGLDSKPRESPEVTPSCLRASVPSCLTDLPPEDPAVYDMICAADTVGVFQIESRAQMSMLPRLRPRCFYDLVIEVAIVRPGPIQGGMIHPYLRRRNGIEPVTYPSEDVKHVLAKTLGIPLFQEQVMRLAVVAAGFTPGEADQLRRAMAAWRLSGSIEKFQLKLIKGMLARGYSKAFAEQIYLQIRGFGEYGFPESHAASFASLVYASAWLKRYHPAAFCAAMLNSQPLGFYTPGQLVRDAIAHGVPVLPVDVNLSGWDCSLEESDEATERRSDEGERQSHEATERRSDEGKHGPALRLGMRLVRGLSEEKVRGLIAERESVEQHPPSSLRRPTPSSLRRFVASSLFITSLHQLFRRGDVSRETLLRLAAADAFRSLGLDRRQALWHILAQDDAEPPLLAEMELDEPPVTLPEMSPDETVVQDYDALGFSLSAHPIGLVRGELDGVRIRHGGTEARRHEASDEATERRSDEGSDEATLRQDSGQAPRRSDEGNVAAGPRTGRGQSEPRPSGSGPNVAARALARPLRISRAEQLKQLRNGQPVAVAGLVTLRQRPGTAKGIVFMTLEDETGMANLIIRPNVWKRDRRIARAKIALIAEGHIERQGEVVHVIVRRFHDLSERLARVTHRSRDFH